MSQDTEVVLKYKRVLLRRSQDDVIMTASYRRGWKRPEHAYIGRRHRHVSRRGQKEMGTSYSHKDQNCVLQKEIRTDRTCNHYEGPVPTTYPCPQSSSRLVQVPVVTHCAFKFPLQPFRYCHEP